ncbi:uncharacterized protein PV07_08714 [Cladophialophora immunda]|uniref:Uncharacterized protein n=1 Tax=Cladophialophora immunda TaxID=569365 RepID=A0A0D2C2Y4_9EURO|nr:uncharacterized protein PV07_08714 [Cladophialophora immunda]KIW25548.1 hypothetical protein PV07_08714 [Cladophialophora immunda]
MLLDTYEPPATAEAPEEPMERVVRWLQAIEDGLRAPENENEDEDEDEDERLLDTFEHKRAREAQTS